MSSSRLTTANIYVGRFDFEVSSCIILSNVCLLFWKHAGRLGTQTAAAVLLHPGKAIGILAAELTVISTHQRRWGGAEEGGGGAGARRAARHEEEN